jgi:hypothetical protein
MRSPRRWVSSRVRQRLHVAVSLPALVTGVWATAATVRAAPGIPAVPAVPAAPAVRADRPPQVTPRPLLAVSLGGSLYANEDMRRTYGSVPAVGLWIHVNDGPSAQYLLGIQYGSKRGNPLYGDPVFEGGETARLTVMSIRIGLRGNLMPRHRLGLFLGLAGEYSRIWETVRGVSDPDLNVPETAHDVGLGGQLLVGPEFELSPGRWVVGTEFSIRLLSIPHEYRHRRWTEEPSGPAVRAYLGRRL